MDLRGDWKDGYPSQKEWGWPVAIEIFCGGTAGGAYILSALPYLIFDGRVFFPGVAVSLLLVLISVLVLIGESTSVWRVPRAFCNMKSPLTVGAISLSLLIISSIATLGILYTGLATGALSTVVWLGITVSLVTILYPGVLMGLMKAIPLWRGSGSSILLLSAALVSGCAVVTLAGGLDKLNFSLSRVTLWGLGIYGLFFLVYIVTGGRSSKTAQISVQRLTRGHLFSLFVVGVMTVGWVLPLALYIMDMISSSAPMLYLGSSLILIGGILMRYSLMVAGTKMSVLGEASTTATYWRDR